MFVNAERLVPKARLENHEELQTKAFETYENTLHFIKKFWPKFNTHFELRYNKRLRTVGAQAIYKPRYRVGRIELNYRLLCENLEHVDQVMGHEIAHLIQMELYPGTRGHGRTWKSIMRLMGHSPKRTHSMDTSKLRTNKKTYVYNCSCGLTHEVGPKKHRNIQNGINYICRKSKKPIGGLAVIGQ